MAFKKIDISEVSLNPFERIGNEWTLLTAGNAEKFNTMTASWGQLGVLWFKNVYTCYIRPDRYTYGFANDNDFYTVSFFTKDYRKELAFCGEHSGKDCDKVKETGLTPVEVDGCVAFAEADMVFVCRKIYNYDFSADSFTTDDGIQQKIYSVAPYHRAYIAEIEAVYVKE